MKRMSYLQKYSFIGLVLLSGCSGSSGQWTEFPIAPEAESIQQYNLENEKAHQVSFTVSAEYPSMVVAEFYSEQVETPWVRCFQDMEWQSFGDGTQTPPAFIHQMLLHWANYEKNRLLLLGVRYVSEGATYRNVPDNQVQDVHLVEYQEVRLEEAVSMLGLNCERT